jgi:hypothetical protein
MAFTTRPMRWNSPLTGWPSIWRAIFWDRSPSATAEMTRATSLVGRTRSSIRPLTEPAASAHSPPAPLSSTRSVRRPSLPAARATRAISLLSWAWREVRALKRFATSA